MFDIWLKQHCIIINLPVINAFFDSRGKNEVP